MPVPEGHVVNPAVVNEASRLGVALTPEAFAEVAAAAKLKLHIAASSEVVSAGLDALRRAGARADARRADAADIARIEAEMAAFRGTAR